MHTVYLATSDVKRAYHNDIVGIPPLSLDKYVLCYSLFNDLCLLEVGLKRLSSFQSGFHSLAINLVNKTTGDILVRVWFTESARGGIGGDIIVNDNLFRVSR